MTLDQLVGRVADRLNLTSDAALVRIAEDIQDRYRWVLSAINLATSTRTTIDADTVQGEREVEFEDCQKVFGVTDEDGNALEMVTFQELRERTLHDDPPSAFAVFRVGAHSTTIWLDVEPASVYTLTADALADTAILGRGDEPAFPEPFHDILIAGARAIELEKMEKPQLAATAQAEFEQRLSDLKFYLAKSQIRMWQGKLAPGRASWRGV